MLVLGWWVSYQRRQFLKQRNLSPPIELTQWGKGCVEFNVPAFIR